MKRIGRLFGNSPIFHFVRYIPGICPFWYTTIHLRSVKSTPTKCINLEQIFFLQQNSVNEIFWRILCFFLAYLVFFFAYMVFFGIVGVFWRSWCFFGVVGVWFGVFGILSSLKMCRFLLINFAEISLYCVFCGKRYTGWKKVHHRRWCGGGLI